jgi:hypothetical protein
LHTNFIIAWCSSTENALLRLIDFIVLDIPVQLYTVFKYGNLAYDIFSTVKFLHISLFMYRKSQKMESYAMFLGCKVTVIEFKFVGHSK